jgi:multidrug transporter EmrE-like cation transporter
LAITSWQSFVGAKDLSATHSVIGAVGLLMTTILSNYLLQGLLGWMQFCGLVLVIIGMRLLK